MTHGQIVTTVATGEEISSIINRVEEQLDGVQRGHAIIALLSLTLVVMYPDITPAQLQNGVKEISQFVCLWLEGVTQEGDTLPKESMN